MKLSDRVDKMEVALVAHLEESGSIRTDLAWLKRAFWVITVAVVAQVVANFSSIGGHHESKNLSEMQQISRDH